MKKIILGVCVVTALVCMTSCAGDSERYVDLETGKTVKIVKDSSNGAYLNADTREPIYIYVDTKTKDTIYGKTGAVINGRVRKGSDNKYVFADDESVKIEDGGAEYKDGDYKVEVEKDGDIKIKDGDTKVKIDGETGERKTKKD